MRVFLACRVEAAVATELARALTPLRERYAGHHFRWIPPENYHITLRFFGAVTAAVVQRIGEHVEPIATRQRIIACRAAAPVPLPDTRAARVIALPVDSDNRLEQLAADCRSAVSDIAGAAEHAFRAHLSILRCRPGARLELGDSAFSFDFVLTSLGLYESVSSMNGSRYLAVEEFAFSMPHPARK